MTGYGGNNDAVKIIQDNAELQNLLRSQRVSREEIIKRTMSCYSGEAYGDCNWSKFDGGWTTPKVPTIYGNFVVQYPNLSQLSLDQGFITHLPEFMDFAKINDLKSLDYFEVREKFKKHLGNKEVYRGMVLGESEVEQIKNNGIKSLFLRLPEERCSIGDFELEVLGTYFNKLVEVHFHGENYMSPLISVSPNEDVATVVGKYFGRKKSEKGELYLFKINVPEIDLVFYTDHAVRKPDKIKTYGGLELKLYISLNGNEKIYNWGRDVESYILYGINPEEIVEVSKPEIKQGAWNNQAC